METTATASLSLLLRHPYSLPPPPPPPWPSFHPLVNRPFLLPPAASHTSLCLIPRHFRFPLLAIRSRNFDFSGLNFDDDKGNFDRKKRRKRSSGKRSKQRPWWSLEEDEEEEEEDSVLSESRSVTFKQVVDSIWIFKVLTSYGWFLPFIMLSLLLATGPKAFLMAFSISLGLSLVILAFQKLWEWLNDSPKPRRRQRTRSFGLRNVVSMLENDDFEEEIQPKRRNRRRDYRSWVAGSDNDRASASSFGGWDDLVITEKEMGRRRRDFEMGTPNVLVEEEKLNRRSLQERDLPLLLRLLIALFPFLGSWTELL